jgi:hypothetical protein
MLFGAFSGLYQHQLKLLLLDTGDGKQEEVTSADAGKAQKMRRRASQAAVSAHLASQTGRRLSKLEKDLYVVDKAIELANEEEDEDEKSSKDSKGDTTMTGKPMSKVEVAVKEKG